MATESPIEASVAPPAAMNGEGIPKPDEQSENLPAEGPAEVQLPSSEAEDNAGSNEVADPLTQKSVQEGSFNAATSSEDARTETSTSGSESDPTGSSSEPARGTDPRAPAGEAAEASSASGESSGGKETTEEAAEENRAASSASDPSTSPQQESTGAQKDESESTAQQAPTEPQKAESESESESTPQVGPKSPGGGGGGIASFFSALSFRRGSTGAAAGAGGGGGTGQELTSLEAKKGGSSQGEIQAEQDETPEAATSRVKGPDQDTAEGTNSAPSAAPEGSSAGGGGASGSLGLFGSFSMGKVLQNHARHLVSQNKRRYQADGFDLDLTYITENIIAMGFPAGDPSSGLLGLVEGLYRNHMDDVISFLEQQHKGKYKVFNLCSERLYDASLFQGTVACFPFDDHNCPPLHLIHAFCASAHSWLRGNIDNVVVVHCKAGMGRTGIMIASLLLYLNYYSTSQEAMQYFNTKRCVDGKGLVLPSQQRYVRYFEKTLQAQPRGSIPTPKKCFLRGLRLHRCPYWIRPAMVVSDHSGVLFSTKTHPKTKNISPEEFWYPAQQRKGVMVFALPGERCVAPVQGDFKITFLDRQGDFYCWLNTNYVSTRQLLITKELDQFDKRSLVSPGFIVEVVVIDADAPPPSTAKKEGAPAAAPAPAPAPGQGAEPATAPVGPAPATAASSAAGASCSGGSTSEENEGDRAQGQEQTAGAAGVASQQAQESEKSSQTSQAERPGEDAPSSSPPLAGVPGQGREASLASSEAAAAGARPPPAEPTSSAQPAAAAPASAPSAPSVQKIPPAPAAGKEPTTPQQQQQRRSSGGSTKGAQGGTAGPAGAGSAATGAGAGGGASALGFFAAVGDALFGPATGSQAPGSKPQGPSAGPARRAAVSDPPPRTPVAHAVVTTDPLKERAISSKAPDLGAWVSPAEAAAKSASTADEPMMFFSDDMKFHTAPLSATNSEQESVPPPKAPARAPSSSGGMDAQTRPASGSVSSKAGNDSIESLPVWGNPGSGGPSGGDDDGAGSAFGPSMDFARAAASAADASVFTFGEEEDEEDFDGFS